MEILDGESHEKGISSRDFGQVLGLEECGEESYDAMRSRAVGTVM